MPICYIPNIFLEFNEFPDIKSQFCSSASWCFPDGSVLCSLLLPLLLFRWFALAGVREFLTLVSSFLLAKICRLLLMLSDCLNLLCTFTLLASQLMDFRFFTWFCLLLFPIPLDFTSLFFFSFFNFYFITLACPQVEESYFIGTGKKCRNLCAACERLFDSIANSE